MPVTEANIGGSVPRYRQTYAEPARIKPEELAKLFPLVVFVTLRKQFDCGSDILISDDASANAAKHHDHQATHSGL